MSRNTMAFFGIGLALLVLVAIIGFRSSFISADVSAIARDLGNAKVRIVELEAVIAAGQTQLELSQQRGRNSESNARRLEDELRAKSAAFDEVTRKLDASDEQCKRVVAEFETKLNAELSARYGKKLEEMTNEVAQGDARVALMEKELSQPASIAKRNQELIDANSQLAMHVQQLEGQLAENAPPSIHGRSPNRVELWRSIVDLVVKKQRSKDQIDYVDELGKPTWTLSMDNAGTSAKEGEWSKNCWERELFPRYQCLRVGWPEQLRPVFDQIDWAGTNGFRTDIRIDIWSIDKSYLAVVVHDVTSTATGRVIAIQTIARSNFPNLDNAAAPVGSRTVTTPNTYTIKSGDTLESIARTQMGDGQKWQLITSANPRLDPKALKIGERITIPESTTSASNDKAAAPAGSSPVAAPNMYTVQKGETLIELSRKFYGTDDEWKRILEANATTLKGDAKAIAVGMKLVIPAKYPLSPINP